MHGENGSLGRPFDMRLTGHGGRSGRETNPDHLALR